MRRILLVLAIGLAACSDSSGPDDEVPVEGSYTLVTINGRPLPVVLEEFFGYRLIQLGGKLTLSPNRTLIERDSLRIMLGQQQLDTTVVFTGTWELEDSVIVLNTRDSSGSTTTLFGVARSGRLVLNFEPASSDSLFQFIYRRD